MFDGTQSIIMFCFWSFSGPIVGLFKVGSWDLFTWPKFLKGPWMSDVTRYFRLIFYTPALDINISPFSKKPQSLPWVGNSISRFQSLCDGRLFLERFIGCHEFILLILIPTSDHSCCWKKEKKRKGKRINLAASAIHLHLLFLHWESWFPRTQGMINNQNISYYSFTLPQIKQEFQNYTNTTPWT